MGFAEHQLRAGSSSRRQFGRALENAAAEFLVSRSGQLEGYGARLNCLQRSGALRQNAIWRDYRKKSTPDELLGTIFGIRLASESKTNNRKLLFKTLFF